MSSFTTSEEIQKQLSIIFGYSGREDIQVGNIIGVGKLTKDKVNELIFETLKYLNSFNAMIRDYAGAEIYALEYELKDFQQGQNNYKLMPKSMLLIPGEYKDSNTFLLALTKETSLLNVHNAKESIDSLGKLFFEVEEVVERPELNNNEKADVLSNFANRFSKKLQGEILEGKWNKKLVGIKAENPNNKEANVPFLTIQPNYHINWNHINKDISANKEKFREKKSKLSDNEKLEHLKWKITGPSGFYIAQNTLQLGAHLLKIANTGSINELQEIIMKEFVFQIEKYLKKVGKILSFEEVILEIRKIMRLFNDDFKKFDQNMEKFLVSGVKGDFEQICREINKLFHENEVENSFINNLIDIQLNVIKDTTFNDIDAIRSNEIKPLFMYLSHMLKASYTIIDENFERYFSYIYLLKLYRKLTSNFNEEMKKEEKPARALGKRFISKSSNYLSNRINGKILMASKSLKFDKNQLDIDFKNIVHDAVNINIDEISINSDDLIQFAEIMLGKEAEKVKNHLNNLKKARSELTFLLSFFLRNSTLNRFIKELDLEKPYDPITISKKFYDFMWKRIGGLNFYWKDYILDVITEFGQVFQEKFEKDEGKGWTTYNLITKFIDYLKTQISNIIIPKNFIQLLDKYIAPSFPAQLALSKLSNVTDIVPIGKPVILAVVEESTEPAFRPILATGSGRIWDGSRSISKSINKPQ